MGEAGLASPGEALGLAPRSAFPGVLPLISTSFIFFPKRLINPPTISIVLPFFNLQASISVYFRPAPGPGLALTTSCLTLPMQPDLEVHFLKEESAWPDWLSKLSLSQGTSQVVDQCTQILDH